MLGALPVAKLGSTGACFVLWAVFAALLAIALWGRPPVLLLAFLSFWITVVLAAALVVTVDAAGVEIDELIRLLDQLNVKSPQGGT